MTGALAVGAGCGAGSEPARTPDAADQAAASGRASNAGSNADSAGAGAPDCQREGYTMDRDCNAPPQSHCIDAMTLGSYDALGRCVAMQCEYTPHPRPCFGGCSTAGCALCPGGEIVDPLSVLRDGALHWPERKCWLREALLDPSRLPHLRGASDAAVPEQVGACPDAAALEWGSIAGEACVDQPVCPKPLRETEAECCYAVYQACGV